MISLPQSETILLWVFVGKLPLACKYLITAHISNIDQFIIKAAVFPPPIFIGGRANVAILKLDSAYMKLVHIVYRMKIGGTVLEL